MSRLRLIIFTIIIYLRNSLFMYILAMNYDKIMILETEHDVNIVDFLLHCLNQKNHVTGGVSVLKFGLGPTPAITVLQCNCNFVIVHRKYVNKEFRKLSTIVNIVDFSHDKQVVRVQTFFLRTVLSFFLFEYQCNIQCTLAECLCYNFFLNLK